MNELLKNPTTWLPVIQITLPIVFSLFVAAWLNNQRIAKVSKRIDGVERRLDGMDRCFEAIGRRFDAVNGRLDEILTLLHSIDKRVTMLEDRNCIVH